MGVDYCRKKEGVERKDHEWGHYPIFLRVIKYSTRGYFLAAVVTVAAGTIVRRHDRRLGGWVAGRATGIMGNNGEKPEGLYQWELAAVHPSNGHRHPQRCWTMHRES